MCCCWFVASFGLTCIFQISRINTYCLRNENKPLKASFTFKNKCVKCKHVTYFSGGDRRWHDLGISPSFLALLSHPLFQMSRLRAMKRGEGKPSPHPQEAGLREAASAARGLRVCPRFMFSLREKGSRHGRGSGRISQLLMYSIAAPSSGAL